MLSTAVANKTRAVLSSYNPGTMHEMHTRGPGSPDARAGTGQQRDGSPWAPAASPALPAPGLGMYLFRCEAAIDKLRHFGILQLLLSHCCHRGDIPSTAQAHSDGHEPCSHQPNRKHDTNITLMSKSPSAGSTFLMRFQLQLGNSRLAGQGVCKALVAGSSCTVQLWGCAVHCSHCKM